MTPADLNTTATAMYNVTSFEDYWRASPEYHLLSLLRSYYVPTFMLVGSLGNITSAVILYRHQGSSQHAISFYMMVYALLNTVVINVVFGLDWFPLVIKVPHLANLADWSCRVWMFFLKVASFYPGWIVVAMTVDRVALYCSVHSVATVFAAQFATVMIAVGLVVISSHVIWMYELTDRHGCVMLEVVDFMTTVWPWIAAMFYSYIPFIVVLTLNILLCVRWRRDISSRQHQFTRATVLVSASYLLTNFPVLLFNFLGQVHPESQKSTRVMTMVELSQLFLCLHHATTFVIYFGTVSLFRESLRCHRPKKDGATELPTLGIDDDNQNEPEANATTSFL